MDTSVTGKNNPDEKFCQDPDIPWIQKVEHLIQKWGVNRYVRMAFLCRLCGKEQQPQHTGNWRNHQLSHRAHRPFLCKTCAKTFKSKYDLKRHMKAVHEEKEIQIFSRICSICSKHLRRRIDLKKHMASAHNIDPEDIMYHEETDDATSEASGSYMLHSPPGSTETTVTEHSKDDGLVNSNTNATYSTERHYICGACFQTFKTKSDLYKHQKKAHPSNDEELRTHICKICQKGFKRKYDLKSSHIKCSLY